MYAIKHGEASNGSVSRLYNIWGRMKARCNNPNNDNYHNYGGRGISVCDEWNDYIPFKKWALENGYNDNLTIERIDVNGNYCPENCKWATIKEQSNNKRDNVIFAYNGRNLTLTQWSEVTGIDKSTLWERLNICKWSVEKALTVPVGDAHKYEFNGEKHTLKEWSEITGIKCETIKSRLYKRKWSIEKALTTPVKGDSK